MSAADVWVGLDLGTQSVRALAVTADGTVAGSGTRKLTGRRDGPRHEQDPEQLVARRRRGEPGRAARGSPGRGARGRGRRNVRNGPARRPRRHSPDRRPHVRRHPRRRRGRPGQRGRRARSGASSATSGCSRPGRCRSCCGCSASTPTWSRGARLAHQSDLVTGRLVGRPGGHGPEQRPQDRRRTWSTRPGRRRCSTRSACPPRVLPAAGPAGTRDRHGVRRGGGGDRHAGRHPDRRRGHGRLRRPARRRGAARGELELRARAPRWCSRGCRASWSATRRGPCTRTRHPTATGCPAARPAPARARSPGDFPGADLDDLNRQAARYEPATALAYPLVSTGERFPFVAPQARGFLLGTPADDGDRFAAVLQGVAFVERLCFDHLDLLGAPLDGDLVLTGGATRSAYWCRLRADVLGRPVTLPENAEPALGHGRAGRVAGPRRPRTSPPGWSASARSSSRGPAAPAGSPSRTSGSSTSWNAAAGFRPRPPATPERGATR